MKCRTYRFLYRLVPVTAWQSFLIHVHFSRCPSCSHEFDSDEELKRLTIRTEQIPEGTDLWDPVRRGLAQQGRRMTEGIKKSFKLFIVIFSILAVVILILLSFLILFKDYYFK